MAVSQVVRMFLVVAACATSIASYAALPGAYSRIKESDFDRGYVRGRVASGESFDFTAPASASVATNVSLRGGVTDYVRIQLPWWPFPLGGDEYRELLALGDGTVWFSDEVQLSSALETLGVAPRDAWDSLPDSCAATCPPLGIDSPVKLSVIWYDVTLDSVRITWQNALLGRDESRPIGYQVELRRDGGFTMRLDLSRIPAGDPVFARAWREFGVARPSSIAWHRLSAGDRDDPDLDGDGIDTEREILDYGTNPHSADTDGDSAQDAQELSWGSDPTRWDTDGDAFSDATDPHPLKANAWKNLNANGFPATWITRWFGTAAALPYADPSRDGIPNLASLYLGVSPRESWSASTSVSGSVLPTNTAAYRAVPSRFSFARPANLTNLLDRTFTVYRDSPWQQLLVMSDLSCYSGWSSSDVAVKWEAGAESGTLPPESWDSFRIPVSDSNTFSRIRITVDAIGDHPQLSAPLYLVVWMPAVTLGTDFHAYWSTAGNNLYMVRNGFDGTYRMSCTVRAGGYPRSGGMDDDVLAAIAGPILPGVSLQGDAFVVDGPRSFYMPRLFNGPRYEVVVYHFDWPQ